MSYPIHSSGGGRLGGLTHSGDWRSWNRYSVVYRVAITVEADGHPRPRGERLWQGRQHGEREIKMHRERSRSQKSPAPSGAD